jgi:uncharacterized delta-60 repeat protein
MKAILLNQKIQAKYFVLYILFASSSLFSQIGILDNTFDPGTGSNANVLSTAIQADGKIIASGSFTTFNSTLAGRIVRLNSDGSIDNTFSPGVGFNNSVNKIILQPDGNIIAAGTFTTFGASANRRLTRLASNGSLDATFNQGTGPNNIVNNAILQNDGKIIIGGQFTFYNGTARARIARANASGSLDNTFNPGSGANNTVFGLALQNDGKIIIGGQFTTYNGLGAIRVARITSAGALDATFSSGAGPTGTGTVVVRACGLQADGKIIIGGFFTTYNGVSSNNIARLNSDGTIDPSFNVGTGANSSVTSINIQPDGKIIIMGQFTSYNGVVRNRIARLNSDGSLDLTFTPGTGSNNTIFTSEFQSDGKLIIGGQFTTYAGTSRVSIARLLMSCPTVTTNLIGQTNLLCNGQSNGTASVSATGGVSQTYSWSPTSNTTSAISNLPAGTYTCYATNECGSSSSLTVNITEPVAFSLTSPTTNTTVCIGADVGLSVSPNGGTGLATYTWNPGNLSGTSQTVNPISTTVYTINSTDANGCLTSITNSVSVVSCPGPVLTGTSCGASLSALDQVLNFSSVSGATNYRLEIKNAAQPFNVVNVRGNNQTIFRMSWVSGIQYGRTYNIRISAFAGGAWQPYGNTCTVTTPASAAIPTTQFSAGSCNITLNTLNQNLNFPLISGATNYRFEIINAAQSFSIVNIRNNTVNYFSLSWISGVQYNRTYDIRISAFVNGAWQPYGNTCSITTPSSIPTTQLSSGSCNITASSASQTLNFNAVSGASNYRVEVVDLTQPLNVVNVRNNTQTTFQLSYVSGIQVGRTYNVRVAANVGGVWAAYGPTCFVTVSASKNSNDESNESILRQLKAGRENNSEFSYSIFPNPNNGIFSLSTTHDTHITIYNMLGDVVMDSDYLSGINIIDISEQKSGIYFVKLFKNSEETNLKIIKQ